MGREADRIRSRSPYRKERSVRSRSPKKHRSDHHSKKKDAQITLPLSASPLSRHDLATHKPMFALYLDIQKQLDIEELPEEEVKGRWKSFVGKWNRGELAEGWYDPSTLAKAVASEKAPAPHRQPSSDLSRRTEAPNPVTGQEDEDMDEDDDYGPSLPSRIMKGYPNRLAGPTVPKMQDLLVQRELVEEDNAASRQIELGDIRYARRVDRKLQTARLDELAPKAEPGTRERQLEKKREKADANKSFAMSKEGGGDMELRDADVMGDEDSLADLKRMKKENERKKTDREIRREEVLRARHAERDERIGQMKAKEEKTMEMLREIAKVRFGSDSVNGET